MLLDGDVHSPSKSMPSVPQARSGAQAPLTNPPDPDEAVDHHARLPTESISHQPSPAVIASSSHVNSHVLPRRFIGPMPEFVVNSEAVEEEYRRFRDLRSLAL
jgi:hypothetical protein